MTGRQLLQWGISNLKKKNKEENIAYIVLKYIDEKAKYIFSDLIVPEGKVVKYKSAISNYIENDIPIALTFNYVYFYNLKLDITKHCFMPRFETEQLVDELSDFLKQINHHPKKVIDLCTGIGAIPLSFKKEFPRIEVFDAFDINEKAIVCAKKSSKRLKQDVNFFAEDFLNYEPTRTYDVIIMNPPYIGSKEEVEDSVLKNDPLDALFSEDNGLLFYKELMKRLDLYAEKRNFVLCFEIGKDQASQVTEIVTNRIKSPKIKVIKDYQQLDRIIIVEGCL